MLEDLVVVAVLEDLVALAVLEDLVELAVAPVDRVAVAVLAVLVELAERVVLPKVLLRVAVAVLAERVDAPLSLPTISASRERTPLLELRISRAFVIPVLRCANERSG